MSQGTMRFLAATEAERFAYERMCALVPEADRPRGGGPHGDELGAWFVAPADDHVCALSRVQQEAVDAYESARFAGAMALLYCA